VTVDFYKNGMGKTGTVFTARLFFVSNYLIDAND
jgi:hypothetical protein